MKAKADKELQTQLAKEYANIISKGLTPVPAYDVDGKGCFHNTRKAAQTAAQIPVNYGQAKQRNKLLYKKQTACQKQGSQLVGFSLVGLFMTLLASLLVDRVHVVTNHYR